MIGRPIAYQARPTDGNNWDLVIGHPAGYSFQLYPLPDILTPYSDHGEASIPSSELPLLNSYFGINSVQVSKLTPSSVEQDQLIEVFFSKNEINPHSGNPNWLHYWSQFIPIEPTATLHYKPSLTSVYAVTDPRGLIGPPRTIYVGPAASTKNVEGAGNEGLHCFYEVLVHESYHLTIFDGWWPTGYDATLDDDDGVPTAWESANTGKGFRPFLPALVGVPGSSNFIYQETMCIAQEAAIPVISAYDWKDWSMNPTNTYQGKQWR